MSFSVPCSHSEKSTDKTPISNSLRTRADEVATEALLRSLTTVGMTDRGYAA